MQKNDKWVKYQGKYYYCIDVKDQDHEYIPSSMYLRSSLNNRKEEDDSSDVSTDVSCFD
ncbi:MAG TPA: hypothetical protein PL054_07705 [Clostridia bacterium]|nr:MAG: hypothetical protein BWX97_00381 [Firmicutes bacterium ADurb.Bin146]HOD93744.1 hypothetical protein [Clostridia bacterium]